MFTTMFLNKNSEKHLEGDVYRDLDVEGKKFRILYGYYEEFERNGKYNDPMPIYPDLINDPVYTDEGVPIVTAMQDSCQSFESLRGDDGDCCQDCAYFKKREDLFGICACFSNRRTEKKNE